MVQRLLTWLYRRLGRSYPFAFIALELQTAWTIAAGTIAIFSLYYDAPFHDYLLLGGVVFLLTAMALSWALYRCFRYVAPVSKWIASEDHDEPVLAADGGPSCRSSSSLCPARSPR